MEIRNRLPDETAREAAARQAAEEKLRQLRAGPIQEVKTNTSLEPIILDSGKIIFIQPCHFLS